MLPIARQAWFLASLDGDDNIWIRRTITSLLDKVDRGVSVLHSSANVSAAFVSTSTKPHPRKAATSFAHWHKSNK